MKYYDLKNISQCYVCGSVDKNINHFLSQVLSHLSKYEKEIHPKEKERQERLQHIEQEERDSLIQRLRTNLGKPKKMPRLTDSYDNSVIIVSGNCGIGTKDLGYYYSIFEKIEKHLAENNCYIFFIRGNSDNPSIFNECKIDFEHVKTIPDYSVVLLNYYNCLCIGGSISMDKSWKLFQEKEFGKKLYWEDEKPVFQEKILEEILDKNKIQCVISNSCPSFAFPGTNFYDSTKWVKKDSTIRKSFIEERQTLDKIYSTIIAKDSKPSAWFYGRFGIEGSSENNDIFFSSLAKHQIFNVNKKMQLDILNIKKNSYIYTKKNLIDNELFGNLAHAREDSVEVVEMANDQLFNMATTSTSINVAQEVNCIGRYDMPPTFADWQLTTNTHPF